MTVIENMEKRDEILSDYEHGLGLPSNLAPGSEDELQGYLVMNRSQIEVLSAEDAFGIALRLSQYSFYLQREMNRERARITWANKELTSAVSGEIGQYSDSYLKNDAKVALICKENNVAKQLSDIQVFAEQRVERLQELASGLRNISYIVSLVAKNKSGDRR